MIIYLPISLINIYCLVHQNYIGIDVEKNPFVLSVCLTEEDNYGVLQYRTILWKRMV